LNCSCFGKELFDRFDSSSIPLSLSIDIPIEFPDAFSFEFLEVTDPFIDSSSDYLGCDIWLLLNSFFICIIRLSFSSFDVLCSRDILDGDEWCNETAGASSSPSSLSSYIIGLLSVKNIFVYFSPSLISSTSKGLVMELLASILSLFWFYSSALLYTEAFLCSSSFIFSSILDSSKSKYWFPWHVLALYISALLSSCLSKSNRSYVWLCLFFLSNDSSPALLASSLYSLFSASTSSITSNSLLWHS